MAVVRPNAGIQRIDCGLRPLDQLNLQIIAGYQRAGDVVTPIFAAGLHQDAGKQCAVEPEGLRTVDQLLDPATSFRSQDGSLRHWFACG